MARMFILSHCERVGVCVFVRFICYEDKYVLYTHVATFFCEFESQLTNPLMQKIKPNNTQYIYVSSGVCALLLLSKQKNDAHTYTSIKFAIYSDSKKESQIKGSRKKGNTSVTNVLIPMI